MPTTRVSERGQVVIPKPIRERLDIKRGQLLDVHEVDGAILMRPRARARFTEPVDWQDWGGVLKGTRALQELEEEHRREIERDR